MDFKELSEKQKLSLYLIAGVLVLITLYACYQVVKTNYAVLYQDNNLANVSMVTTQLTEETVDFKLADQGTTILVPEDKLNLLKVELAQTQTIAGSSPGFELFDNVDYSMTEHAQKITFQRAIQGELEQTLKTYVEIVDARVHVTMPEKRLFSQEQSKVKASVSLWLASDAVFSQPQVQGVQELVASSVDGLLVDDIIVLDANGKMMSVNQSNSDDLLVSRKRHQELEVTLTEKANNLLSLYFNKSELAVSVTVLVDQTQEKQTTRSLLVNKDNEGVVTRKKESFTTDKNSKRNELDNRDSNVEIEYEHGLETAETIKMAGDVKQVSVAIAIKSNIDEVTKTKIKNLIFAGLGLNNARGDQLSVEVFPKIVAVNAVQPNIEQNLDASNVVEAPVEKIKNDEVIAIPATEQTLFWALGLLMFFILIAGAGFLMFGKKSLTKKEQEVMSLQFNEWLNIKEVNANVK